MCYPIDMLEKYTKWVPEWVFVAIAMPFFALFLPVIAIYGVMRAYLGFTKDEVIALTIVALWFLFLFNF